MSKGGRQQTATQTQTLDPNSQRYVNQMRDYGRQGVAALDAAGPITTGPITAGQIRAAMNPYAEHVVDATRGEFDRLRSLAEVGTNQAATQAGAYGGARHALTLGSRLGELDRAEAAEIAGLRERGYGQALGFAEHQRRLEEERLREPLLRYGQGLNLYNLGMGPVGWTGTTSQDLYSSFAGNAMGGSTIGAQFGPYGALAGAVLGGLLGEFG